MNATLRLTSYIDYRNEELWKEVNKHIPVDIQPSDENCYKAFTRPDSATIFVTDIPCADSFTHELLHVYIKTKNIFIGGSLIRLFEIDPILSSVYTDDLLDYLFNVLDHIKIFPIYIAMGYDKSKFISDYDKLFCDAEIAKEIGYCLQYKLTLKAGANDYIGKYFSIKCSPNKNHDYSEALTILKKADPKLYVILENFFNSWNEFEIDKYHSVWYHYDEMCNVFVAELKEWTIVKLSTINN